MSLRAVRKTLKFLHTMGSIGFLGAIAALMVLHAALPHPAELDQFAAVRISMGAIATWMLLPSMGLVVVSGLLAIAATPAFQDRLWVWIKAASGIIVFEGTLAYLQAPMERAAIQARGALAGEVPVNELSTSLPAEWGSFWVIGLVAVANVVLGVWRPSFRRRRGRPDPAAAG